MTSVLDESFAPYDDDKPLDEYEDGYKGRAWTAIQSDLNAMKQIVEENTNNLHDMTFPSLIIKNNIDKIDLKSKPDGLSYGNYIISKIKESKCD